MYSTIGVMVFGFLSWIVGAVLLVLVIRQGLKPTNERIDALIRAMESRNTGR
jgi:hypothetical protein